MITLCSSEKVGCFRGISLFHLQGQRVPSKKSAGTHLLLGILLEPKLEVTYSSETSGFLKLHSITMQKTVLFIITTVRTSDPTFKVEFLNFCFDLLNTLTVMNNQCSIVSYTHNCVFLVLPVFLSQQLRFVPRMSDLV